MNWYNDPFKKKKSKDELLKINFSNQGFSNSFANKLKPHNIKSVEANVSKLPTTSNEWGKPQKLTMEHKSLVKYPTNVPYNYRDNQQTQQQTQQQNKIQGPGLGHYGDYYSPQQQLQGVYGSSSFQSLRDKGLGYAEARKQREEDYYNKKYAAQREALEAQIPQLQKQFADTQGFFEKGIASQQAKAEQDIAANAEKYQAMQREAAQTRREGEGRIAGRFANLGTGDSYGYGSHQQAQQNLESDFNRYTQENKREQERQAFEINRVLQDFELNAQQKMNDLKGQMETAIQKIQGDISLNAIDKQGAIDQAISNYEDSVQGIQSDYLTLQQELSMKMSEIGEESLSPEFRRTGTPQTETDYRFYIENQSAYDRMRKQEKIESQETEKSREAIDVIERLLQSKTAGITGNQRWIVSNASRASEGLLKRLAAILQVEAKQRIDGLGTMTDGEWAMLRDVSTALSLDSTREGRLTARVSNKKFREILQEILDKRNAKLSGAGYDTTGYNTSSVIDANNQLINKHGG